MALLDILTYPDVFLTKKAKPVVNIDDALNKTIDDMIETMREQSGIGLAAPQVGAFLRVIVVDASRDGVPHDPLKMANPEIVWASEDKCIAEEGCLSVPKQYADIERPSRVRVRYLDEKNAAKEIDLDGLLARVVQHEMDHLDGVLFIDYLSKIKRDMLVKKAQRVVRDRGAA